MFDRLIDEQPDSPAGEDSREQRVLSRESLRSAVLRDLRALLNATSLSSIRPMSAYPLASRSVVNFGILDLAGKIATSLEPEELEREIVRAILDYEPRIRSESVRVRLIDERDDHTGNRLLFEVEGDIWGHPLPDHVLLRTELDLDAGEVSVYDAERGGR